MRNRLELINLFEYKNKIGKGIEIGTYEGAYASEILKIWTGDLYLVDIWRKMSDVKYLDSCNREDYINVIHKCCQNIEGNEHRCHMIRSGSENVAKLFCDESLDFIYLDANHRYEAITSDMKIWFPKLRKGGVFAGHDFLKIDWFKDLNFAEDKINKHIYSSDGQYLGLFGVNPAVEKFCVDNNYILEVTTDEWFGSWYFIK